MKKNQIRFYIPFLLSMVLLCYSCHDSNDDNIFSQLKENGKINTFSLTLIVSDKLSDSSLSSIKDLCVFSNDNCKTLPDAGILRLGSNMYYPYNSVSELRIPESIANNEEAITKTVEEQVNVYFSTTKPKDYDSLLASNHADWDERTLAINYINKIPTDSVLFFSDLPDAPSIQIGNKTFTVYTRTADLRKKIDDLICRGYGSINVFLNPPATLAVSGSTVSKTYPAKGTVAGDTCIGFSKFEKVHDGFGSFMAGKLLEANSTECGGGAPEKVVTEPRLSKEKATTVEKPAVKAKETLKENAPVVKEKTAPVERPTARPRINETESETDVIKTNAGEKGNNRCVRRSDPTCETDGSGNYTGRRVQYCYNNKGNIIQTIVLKKCDSDCRCL